MKVELDDNIVKWRMRECIRAMLSGDYNESHRDFFYWIVSTVKEEDLAEVRLEVEEVVQRFEDSVVERMIDLLVGKYLA